ncbi:MAG TPA: GspH/FimT family pseudopilin [Pseudomonas sp.]|uniref:GspH/FimT family pseudopilin n=1 Tax=Pseudomonas sp. TaxID=306 RepID=UPI002BFA6DF4|nr:GspH/FimT family pseudopilin [Pseudomonas sp.]HSX86623.1 GspH/FimT family pseudopilin [Pseudomonas sp.]
MAADLYFLPFFLWRASKGVKGAPALFDRIYGVSAMSQKGFTLIELMTTIAIFAVLLGLAAPNLTELLNNNRAATEINSFAGMFAYARREAVQRGQTTKLQGPLTADGSWQVLRNSDGLELRLFPELSSFKVDPTGMKTVLFDSQGQLISAAAISFDLLVKDSELNCDVYNRSVVIELSGAASVRKRGC